MLTTILSFVLISSTLFSVVPFDAKGSSKIRNDLDNSSSKTNLIAESESRAQESQVKDAQADISKSKEERPPINKQQKVNHAPSANAGPDVTVNENQKVILSGEASKDVDGDRLSFLWTQVSPKNPKVNLKNSHSEKLSVDIPDVEKSITFKFLLAVKDGNGEEGKDQITVKVNNIGEEKIPTGVTSSSERSSINGEQTITGSVKLDNRIDVKRAQSSVLATEACSIVTFVCDVNEGEAISKTFTWGVVHVSTGAYVQGLVAHVIKQSGPAGLELSSTDGNPATVTFKWDNPTPGTHKAIFALQILFCPASQTRACNDYLNNRNQPVTFTINVNGKPTANDQKASTDENTPVDIVLTATDPNNDKLTYVLASQPTHGSLDGAAPTLTYNPDSEYTGPDSFTFKVNDGKIDSNIATVDIQVKPLACSPTVASGFAATATSCGEFTLDCSAGTTPPKIPIKGGSKDIKCSVASKDGFDDPVSLTCKAIQINPTISCDADPPSLTPPAGGNTPFNIKVKTTDATKKGNYEIKVEGKAAAYQNRLAF